MARYICMFLSICLTYSVQAQIQIEQLSDEAEAPTASAAPATIYTQGFHDKTMILQPLPSNEEDDYSMIVVANPAQNEIVIKTLDGEKGTIVTQLMDENNTLIFEEYFHSEEGLLRIPMNTHTAGRYYIQIEGVEDGTSYRYQLDYNGEKW